jgi:hypothetical protein
LPESDTHEDELFAFTPISVPDRERRSARGRLKARVAGGVAGAVVASLLVWWIVAANTDHKPVKHVAEFPLRFGDYAHADHDTWPASDGNTDFAKGAVRATYTAPGDKEAWIALYRDPGAQDYGISSDDDAVTSTLTKAGVRTGPVRSYPSGMKHGAIKCADTMVDSTHGFTSCTWQDTTMAVDFTPGIGAHTVLSTSAPADFRAFLAGLRIKPAKAR